MRKRILNYRKRIDTLLEKNAPDTDWEDVLSEHLVQIGFFQHERLVHLMVTMAVVIAGLVLASPVLLALTLLFLLLLIPYIMHYYLLENETQKMYIQYDKILEHVRQEKQ